jgi:hypothetical protein
LAILVAVTGFAVAAQLAFIQVTHGDEPIGKAILGTLVCFLLASNVMLLPWALYSTTRIQGSRENRRTPQKGLIIGTQLLLLVLLYAMAASSWPDPMEWLNIGAFNSGLIVGAVLAFASLAWLTMRAPTRKSRWLVVVLLLLGALVVSAFAFAYCGSGVGLLALDDSGRWIYSSDFGTALYFSVATFATLGLGDVRPIVAYRGVVAAETLIGYAAMGILIAVLGHRMRNWD